MKKVALLILFVLLATGASWYALSLRTSPTTNTSALPTLTTQPTQKPVCDALQIVSPQKDDAVTSPLQVTAIVNNSNPSCHWTVFEAQAGKVEVIDANGKVLGQSVLKTSDDRMQASSVTYTSTTTFSKPATSSVTLRIIEENPSGKANPQVVSLPLTVK